MTLDLVAVLMLEGSDNLLYVECISTHRLKVLYIERASVEDILCKNCWIDAV